MARNTCVFKWYSCPQFQLSSSEREHPLVICEIRLKLRSLHFWITMKSLGALWVVPLLLQRVGTGDEKAVTCHQPHPVPRQWLLWKSMALNGMEYLFNHLGSAVPVVSSHSVVTVEGRVWREKALMLHKHCSATAEALLCYQHCFGHRSTIQHHACRLLWRKPTPS